jgi:predicted amidohydrolase
LEEVVRAALAQIDSGIDVARNLECIQRFTRVAADDGADLVVFPEYSMYEKKVVDQTFAGAAEPLDGPFARALGRLAREQQVTLVAGVVESNPRGPRPYNTIVAFGPAGDLLAAYRKTHLFDSYGFHESACITPAPDLDPAVFEVAGARAGLMTCYDLRFPEVARRLADADADLMLVCSSWVPGDGKADQWRVLARARAIENACFVAAVSQTVPVSIGRSLLVDPAGVVLRELDPGPAVAVIDVDLAAVSEMRRKNPALEHRRFAVVPASGLTF